MKVLSITFTHIMMYIFALTATIHCEDENYFEKTINPEEMVDPHSFYYDKHTKRIIKEDNEEVIENSSEEYNKIEKKVEHIPRVDNHNSHERIFYKRLIHMLLSNISIKTKDEVSVVGILEVEVSHSQMEILQNFHIQKTSLREIDEILSNIIRKPQDNYICGFKNILDVLFANLGVAFRFIQERPDGVIIVFALLIFYWTFKMIKRGQGLPIFILIQFIFIVSFFMTWWQLIQEAEIKSAAAQMKFSNVPISCQPHKMNMWDKFVSLMFDKEDCEQYYQAIMSNPKLKITPAFALSHFITTVILHPITHVGTVISVFINNATEGVSWIYAWIIKLLLFLCIGLAIIIIPFCLAGASFNIRLLGPLLRFGIDYKNKGKSDTKDEKRDSLENASKREPVQIILQLSHATNVPAIKSASETEQSDALQIQENDTKKEEESRAIDDGYKKLYEDLSCGDIVVNTKFPESHQEKRNEVETEKKDGSGDS